MGHKIDFDRHTTVLGITRSGKTYATKRSLAAAKEGALFFNTQHEDMPGFTMADWKNGWEQIEGQLRQGKKINYKPQFDEDTRNRELSHIINRLHDGTEKRVILAVDEVHLFGKQAVKDMVRIATTGLRFGVKGVWLSQRPANIDNTLMTQSEQFVMFKMNMESSYLERYRMPAEEIKSKIEEGGKYAFVIYDWESVKGSFKA